MPPVDAYVSQVSTSPSVRQVSIPDIPGGSVVAGALAGLGDATSDLARVVRAGAKTATRAQATTDYMQIVYDEQKARLQDSDYQTAPARFSEARLKAESDILGRDGLDNEDRAELQTSFRRIGLSAQGEIDNHALNRLSDATVANLDKQDVVNFQRYRQASTPVQRQAVIADWDAAIAAPASTGLISEQQMVARQQQRDTLLQKSDALALIEKDPAAAIVALADPEQFPALNPIEREQFRETAGGQASAIAVEQVVQRAHFNPAIASLELGRVVDPTHLDTIFNDGLIAQESGGDPNAVSPKNAIGIAQVILPTAREMASDLGLTDVAKLSDSELKSTLLKEPELNATLGRAYLEKMAKRYDGSVPLALAAYNAGPARADRWKAEAEAQFGPGYSPAQLVSAIDIAETKNYVAQIYGRMGARLDPGILPGSVFAATNRVGEVISADQRQRDQGIRDLAAVGRSSDATIEALKQGLPVAGEAFLGELQTQQAAAATGSVEAVTRVRELTEAWANAPLIRKAYAMPPANLEAALAGERARLAKKGATSGEEFRTLKAYEAVSETIEAEAGKDPLGLADRARIVGVEPFDPNADFSARETIRNLQVRDFQSGLAQKTYRGARLPFRPEEASALKARFDQADWQEKVSILHGLGEGLGHDSFRAAVGQIADENSGLAYAADIAHAAGTDETLSLILEQYALERSKDYKPAPVTPSAAGAIEAATYGTAMLAMPSRQAALRGNAEKIFLSLARRRGVDPDLTTEPAKTLFNDALGMAAGQTTDKDGEQLGGIANVNGFQTLAPVGFRADEVEPVLHGLTDDQLATLPAIASANGLKVKASEIHNAELIAVGDGVYRVAIGQRIVTDAATGGPWLLDIQKLAGLPGSAPRQSSTRFPLR